MIILLNKPSEANNSGIDDKSTNENGDLDIGKEYIANPSNDKFIEVFSPEEHKYLYIMN